MGVGQAAPVIDVETWSGEHLQIGAAQSGGLSTLVLFVSPSCPICRVLLPILDSLQSAEGASLQILLASDGPREEHEEFVVSLGARGESYILSRELGLQYEVAKLPYAVLIDNEGTLVARGLVNSREHLESLFEARDHEVASLQEFLSTQPKSEGARVA